MTDSNWTTILSPDQLTERYRSIDKLDRNFSKRQREFYESRTKPQLGALAHQSWLCCESEQYQLAKSYLALCPD